jgi:hypothetical protein
VTRKSSVPALVLPRVRSSLAGAPAPPPYAATRRSSMEAARSSSTEARAGAPSSSSSSASVLSSLAFGQSLRHRHGRIRPNLFLILLWTQTRDFVVGSADRSLYAEGSRERKEWVPDRCSAARGLAGFGRDRSAMVADREGIGRGGGGGCDAGEYATMRTTD